LTRLTKTIVNEINKNINEFADEVEKSTSYYNLRVTAEDFIKEGLQKQSETLNEILNDCRETATESTNLSEKYDAYIGVSFKTLIIITLILATTLTVLTITGLGTLIGKFIQKAIRRIKRKRQLRKLELLPSYRNAEIFYRTRSKVNKPIYIEPPFILPTKEEVRELQEQQSLLDRLDISKSSSTFASIESNTDPTLKELEKDGGRSGQLQETDHGSTTRATPGTTGN
jgi:hypothetical protein